MQAYTPSNSIFDGPVTNLLSILCILTEILSHVRVKGHKSPYDISDLAPLLVVFQVTAWHGKHGSGRVEHRTQNSFTFSFACP